MQLLLYTLTLRPGDWLLLGWATISCLALLDVLAPCVWLAESESGC